MLGPDSPHRSTPPLARAKWAKADKRASTCIDDLRGASFTRVAVSCALDRIAARGRASLQSNNLNGLIFCRFEYASATVFGSAKGSID